MKKISGKKTTETAVNLDHEALSAVTVENLMQETGMARRTITLAIQKHGWSQNGVKTILTRAQADQIKTDLIVNATQYETGTGNRAQTAIQEPSKAALLGDPRFRAIKIAMDMERHYEALLHCKDELLQCKDEILTELEKENTILKVKVSDQLLENERIHDDLRHANQKLEFAGLHLTDRDDMRALYRR